MSFRAVLIVMAALLSVPTVTALPAWAHEGHAHTKGTGTLNAVDAAGHKVNISHKPIPELGWPAMRMDFTVADTVDLKALPAGSQVQFVLEKNKNGKFEIQSITPVGGQ